MVFAPPAWEKEGALRGRHKSAEMSPPPPSSHSIRPPVRDHRLARASTLQLAIKYLPCSRVSLPESKTSKSHSVWQCAADVTTPSLQQKKGPAVSCDVYWRSSPWCVQGTWQRCSQSPCRLLQTAVTVGQPNQVTWGRAGHKTDTGRHSAAQRDRLIGRVSSPVPHSLSLCLSVLLSVGRRRTKKRDNYLGMHMCMHACRQGEHTDERRRRRRNPVTGADL